jgi:hypothetical protein
LIKQLGLYKDSVGILRCQGRLNNINMCESTKHPILLPKDDLYTKLVVEHVHKRLMHSGVSQTLSQVRVKFWIHHGRAFVRKTLKLCFVCRRYEGGPYKTPAFAPLPTSRVTEDTPFSNTGLDYMGPLYVKQSSETKKVWICLFTCMTTRAIHMELVQDLSTTAFLNCLRRFISTRGTPKKIISDNAMQFQLASKTLNLVWSDIIVDNDVQSYCATHGIKWCFIVELAPWMGGFYERLIGLVKRSLRKTIGRRILTGDQLQTVIKESEAVVNSRPLVYVNDNINSSLVITPSSFLGLNPHIGLP